MKGGVMTTGVAGGVPLVVAGVAGGVPLGMVVAGVAAWEVSLGSTVPLGIVPLGIVPLGMVACDVAGISD